MLTEEERIVQQAARTFASQVLQPKIVEAYRMEKPDLEIMKQMGGEWRCY